MTDDLRALLADLNTWPMYLSRDGDGNDLTTISKGQVAGALRAILAAHPEPATPATGPTCPEIPIVSRPERACWNCKGYGVLIHGLGENDEIVWVPPFPCPICDRTGLTPVPPETPREEQP